MAETLDVCVRVRPSRKSPFVVDAAFSVPPGITILFGPSGAGKSTTLAAIAGLLVPEAGRIRVGEEVWFDHDARVDRPAHRRGVGLVFQSLALFPHLTALANVAYGIGKTPDREQRARRLLQKMRVEHLAERHPVTFSGGEAQRVALARAFAIGPRVLLLDEAFSAMDEPLRRELQADVRAFVDEARIPVLQITHHREEARALGDRVVVLEDGRVKAAGSTTLLTG